ncbi:hypothetical protein PAXINDRAFT_132503, partial [Paxillus involutus ATCC 200175]
MEHVAPHFISPPSELSQAHLTTFNFRAFIETVKGDAPLLWRVMGQISYSDKQRLRNTHKDPDMVILHQISQAQYTRSHNRGRIAKPWALFLKSCGLSARAFDALHELGAVMSHKWTANAYCILAERAMEEARVECCSPLTWSFSSALRGEIMMMRFFG